jgi:glycosyltransferase involved in cell wall biosynthesis
LNSVLILNHEPLSELLAGPSIRNWELAHALSGRFDVTIAAPGPGARQSADFKVVEWGEELPLDLVRASDVVKVSGFVLAQHPRVAEARHLVVDLYDPFPLENLHMYEEVPAEERYRIAALDREAQTALIRAGDVFLCASERQRDFWLGWMAAAGRLNPYMHAADPGLERFMLVLPFGVPDEPPAPRPPRFRGALPGIANDDLIVVWGGGIWNWFDPLTLIEAAERTRDLLPKLRVVFPATTVPSPDVLPMRMLREAREFSDRLGLTGSRVFFGTSWIPHGDFGGVLLEADIGVSLHQVSVETRFSFRTRILDYLWAGLPIIATECDSMADLIRSEELGAVVPPQDVDAVVDALVALATDASRRRACGERSRAAAQQFRWSVVAKPLADYCAAPSQAPDRQVVRSEGLARPWDGRRTFGLEARRLKTRIGEVASDEGPVKLAAKGARYVLRRSGLLRDEPTSHP